MGILLSRKLAESSDINYHYWPKSALKAGHRVTTSVPIKLLSEYNRLDAAEPTDELSVDPDIGMKTSLAVGDAAEICNLVNRPN